MYQRLLSSVAVERCQNEARGMHGKVESCKEEVQSYLEQYPVAMGPKIRRVVQIERVCCWCKRRKIFQRLQSKQIETYFLLLTLHTSKLLSRFFRSS